MIRADAPLFAKWTFEHWTPDGWNDAPAGDLMESFRAGRSSRWYCRHRELG